MCQAHGSEAAVSPNTSAKGKERETELSPSEVREVEEHTLLPVPFVYQTVRQEGERELGRPPSALWWSGLTAGMLIGLSVFGEAVLHVHLPEAPWRPLVESFGYCFGFLIVILSRHQLFTENTITPILPLMVRRTWPCLLSVARLWSIVAVANLVGAFAFAAFWSLPDVAGETTSAAMLAIGRHTMENGWLEMLYRAIPAGFLMASLVWMMPSAGGAKFWIIILMTYLIAVGDFTHIVAGGVEILLLVLAGEVSPLDFAVRFGIPVFIGNVVGGTGLFSLIVYAQVRQEILGERKIGRNV
jgi:formate/nitrite transporter FocA (FNT family)